jgi:restriction system protein
LAIWIVRAGKHGEREGFAIEKSVATIGWSAIPDLAGIATRADMAKAVTEEYPNEPPKRIQSWVGQLWRFANEIQINDLVAMPLKLSPHVCFGAITGPYKYRADFPEDARHTHEVHWMIDVPRISIDPDLRFSLGSTLTVAKIERNNAEERFRKLVQATIDGSLTEAPEPAEDTEAETLDLEALGRDAIRTLLKTKFAGHKLAALVEGVFQARGYVTKLSPPGPDGGVDILAGSGAHGFDSPRIVVQVKSGDLRSDVKIARELKGTMDKYRADNGILVSFGGFKRTVEQEVENDYFRMRLWSGDDLIDAITEVYHRLPEDIRADIPLKQVWTLAEGD